MVQNEDIRKVNDFVGHLLMNPNIKNEPLLVGEGLLLNFIVQNQNQLKLTFKSPQFFPHLEWPQILQIMVSSLYDRVVGEILPVTAEFLDNTNFDGLNKLSGSGKFPGSFYREKLDAFVKSIIKNKDVRYNMSATVNIFRYKMIERYIGEIFKRRDYLYNELVRVQKTSLDTDEYIVLLKTLLLVRNAAHVKIPLSPGAGEIKVNLADSVNSAASLKKYIERLVMNLITELPMLSERTLQLAIKSNLREGLTDKEDASSRFLFIFCARYLNYKPIARIDRGAESPDKSWFGIARKNAEYYGYNKRMLDDLYLIAGDNNW